LVFPAPATAASAPPSLPVLVILSDFLQMGFGFLVGQLGIVGQQFIQLARYFMAAFPVSLDLSQLSRRTPFSSPGVSWGLLSSISAAFRHLLYLRVVDAWLSFWAFYRPIMVYDSDFAGVC